jgi:hypothetical protein
VFDQPTLCQEGSDAPLDWLCLLLFQKMLVRRGKWGRDLARISNHFFVVVGMWLPKGSCRGFLFPEHLANPQPTLSPGQLPCTAFFSQDLSLLIILSWA